VAVGDLVWGLLPVRGTRWGAYAELVEVRGDRVARRPPGLTSVEAAAIPPAGSTALQLLDRLELSAGESLLVHGAAGGVGGDVDAVADLRGHGLLARSLPAVKEGGRAASIVELTGDFEEAVDRNITLHGVLVRPSAATLDRLAAAAGRLAASDRRSAGGARRDRRAHRRLETGHGQGNIVLRISS
jgi:NADPH:quinone reductase